MKKLLKRKPYRTLKISSKSLKKYMVRLVSQKISNKKILKVIILS